tara:strand:- start:1679 stop:1969 length:291 start_codon:yes stop_codon:yes gene_type:complete
MSIVSTNAIDITKLLLQGMIIEPRLKLLFLTSRKLDNELKKNGCDRWNILQPVKIYDRRLFLLAQKEQQLMDELNFTYNGHFPIPNKTGNPMWIKC